MDASPTIKATAPPINIHIDLSVGEPVKNRETSELKDWDALRPNAIKMTPTASKAIETALFIQSSFGKN